MTKPSVTVLMSFNGGVVDTAGFLALQGLFTAHVTGNFVTLGAAIVPGTSGAMAKLLALPMFCAVVIVTQLISYGLRARGIPVLRTMLGLQLGLLTVGGIFAASLGPFQNGDAWTAILTGITLVAAMAIQNAAHRVHLASAPPTTLMTGTTTQIMLDIADLIHSGGKGVVPETRSRLARMSASVAAFALGCCLAALSYALVHTWCFVLPPAIGLLIVLSAEVAAPPRVAPPKPNLPTKAQIISEERL